MAGMTKVKGKPAGIMMNLAEIVFAYNTLKGEPIPHGMAYDAAADALCKEFGFETVCDTGNKMEVGKYLRGEYDFQADNQAKGISQ